MQIFCIEGCHGSGKTHIINELKRRGLKVLDENFIGMPSLGLKPQSFTMELIWICKWIERALELKCNSEKSVDTVRDGTVRDGTLKDIVLGDGTVRDSVLGNSTLKDSNIYFADRSPYSAILYAEWGVLLKPIIQQNLIDLKRAGIDIINIYINVQDDVLWDRISSRLALEPEREKYNENSRSHMTKVIEFYKSHDDLWHHTVDNTEDNIKNVADNITAIVAESVVTSN
jgi:thymidylate kinase